MGTQLLYFSWTIKRLNRQSINERRKRNGTHITEDFGEGTLHIYGVDDGLAYFVFQSPGHQTAIPVGRCSRHMLRTVTTFRQRVVLRRSHTSQHQTTVYIHSQLLRFIWYIYSFPRFLILFFFLRRLFWRHNSWKENSFLSTLYRYISWWNILSNSPNALQCAHGCPAPASFYTKV